MAPTSNKSSKSGTPRRRLSLSHRECPPPEAPKTLRSTLPQIFSCAAAVTFMMSEGLSLSYSSSLIPALRKADSEIPITENQGVLLASMMVVTMALAAPLAGVIMNRFGRLNAIRISTIPFALSWFLVASAQSYEQILIGRLITGLANVIGVSSVCVYITEVAAPHIRGALNGTSPTVASLGVLITYLLGAYTHWRTTAWICGASPILTIILLYFVGYESPIWLVSKGRHAEAERSLRAFARYNSQHDTREMLPERQLAWLIQRHKYTESASEKQEPWYIAVLDLFRLSVGYKPLLILTGVFVAQNFSGVYITLFYAAPFFQEMGLAVDEFEAAVYVGLTRFAVGMIAVGLIRKVGVRILMVISSFGMAVCMVLSGYFTLYPHKDLGGWLPVGLVLLYVAFSCCGLLTVPWIMTAEVFPDQLRDAGQAVTVLVADLLMFLGLQLYPTLRKMLEFKDIPGSVGLQWFFAVVALLNVVLVIFLLPETHGKTLQEIEEHYEQNTLWLGRKKDPPVGGLATNVEAALARDPNMASVVAVHPCGNGTTLPINGNVTVTDEVSKTNGTALNGRAYTISEAVAASKELSDLDSVRL